MPNSKMIIVGCARVSSLKQELEGSGLDSQIAICSEYSRRTHDRDLDHVFTDRITGKSTKRPGMDALLAFLRKNRKKHSMIVVTDDLSRLARHNFDYGELKNAVIEAGAVMECPTFEFGTDPASVLRENIQVSLNQYERESNAVRVARRMRGRLLDGFWCLPAPFGYKHNGRGKPMARVEPIASVVAEALEGYAAGRFETGSEVGNFLENSPEISARLKSGRVAHDFVGKMLRQPLYAGIVYYPKWEISWRKGHHEALISLETYQQIQDRLQGKAKAPARADLNRDFPLRGFVECDECGSPLTAAWSKGRKKRYPYYVCHKKGCPSYRKSIRRSDLEGEFEKLLSEMRPVRATEEVVMAMLKDIWAQRVANGREQRARIRSEIRSLQKEEESFLDRIVKTNNPAVIEAYEKRICSIQQRCLVLHEASEGKEDRVEEDFSKKFEPALDFISNPHKIWKNHGYEWKQAVLRLAFSERLKYSRERGVRTPNFTFPFSVLSQRTIGQEDLVEPRGVEPLTSSLRTTRSTN